MDKYTASNGLTVHVRVGGTVQFTSDREESSGILQVFPGSEWWQALREFFRAEEDERLGRWRWPANPDWVVFPPEERQGAFALNESTGEHGELARWEAELLDPSDNPLFQALSGYFDAHPESKPWHDAKHGEVWAVTVDAGREFAARVVVDTGFPRFIDLEEDISYGPRAGIIAGRRIWPES